MPWFSFGYGAARRFCERPFAWSTKRGGCRFDRGHKGPCKPGRYRR